MPRLADIELEALLGLRLQTPRLELRLGTDAEVRALGRLAELGIHPAWAMPFSIPWTDQIGSESFLEEFASYHRSLIETWQPDDWHLGLLVWADGKLVGTQSLFAKGFGERGEVTTGSWVGAAFQRRGIGTEMRSAALELGFSGLGARAAVSSWLDGNDASRRVSEKLGYEPAGMHTESPRGLAVAAHDTRLERARWHAPVPVEISGLAPALALFGATQPSERSAAPSD